jgi:hypothetical protein
MSYFESLLIAVFDECAKKKQQHQQKKPTNRGEKERERKIEPYVCLFFFFERHEYLHTHSYKETHKNPRRQLTA